MILYLNHKVGGAVSVASVWNLKMSKKVAELREPTLDKLLAARSLSRQDLEIVCSEDDCNKLALKIANWKVLCPFIRLSAADEADIDADYRKNAEKKIGKGDF